MSKPASVSILYLCFYVDMHMCPCFGSGLGVKGEADYQRVAGG